MPSLLNRISPHALCALALAAAQASFAAEGAVPVLELSPSGRAVVDTRVALYGQNMTAADWHGRDYGSSRGQSPVLWDVAGGRPDPAWDALTHAYPLRVVRYHSGNQYPWRDAVGPVADRRPIISDAGGHPVLRTGAGLQEFLRWVETLPQKPEVSLIASPFRPVVEIADLVAYCNATAGPMAALRASHGHPAPYGVKYWELGNETDWIGRADLDVTRADTDEEKLRKLPVDEYIRRCRARIDAMRAVDPSIRIFAHAQTAPWPVSNPQWRAWHREVIRQLGGRIDGIVIHPYYDGYSVPYVLASVDALIADIKALEPKGRNLTVWVNEHARWVNPADRANWSQSWSLQGAISTGDFLLRCMARPEISMANYWCYLAAGPWRVLDADWSHGGTPKFGTAINALFQLLNDAALPKFELLTVGRQDAASSRGYAYAVTAGLFIDPASGRHALVAVNRSDSEAFNIRLDGESSPPDGRIHRALITADSLRATNVPSTPNAVTLHRDEITLRQDTSATSLLLMLPPRSIVSWSW